MVVVLLGLISLSCTSQGDCLMWPDRPNCEPVGTTTSIRMDWDNDPSCVETRYYDEVGEAGMHEIGCS